MADLDFIFPDWPAPAGVRAAVTTRAGGCSGGPFASFNLAGHVGDDPAAVAANRARLRAALGLPTEPLWLTQVHGAEVARFGAAGTPPTADAAVATVPGQVCVVMVADCLPVVFASRDGSAVGVAHAGWRGLAAGVLERTLEALARPAGDVLAWLGPCIGPQAFEVGEEVRQAFIDAGAAAEGRFAPNPREVASPPRGSLKSTARVGARTRTLRGSFPTGATASRAASPRWRGSSEPPLDTCCRLKLCPSLP